HLIANLPSERLSIAYYGLAAAEAALDWTLAHARERTLSGVPMLDHQAVRFRLAELVTEVEVTRAYLERLVLRYNAGELDVVDAAKAKWWATETQRRVLDACLRLLDGEGVLLGRPLTRAFLDARVQPIYGGTTEIMKEIIGRSLRSGPARRGGPARPGRRDPRGRAARDAGRPAAPYHGPPPPGTRARRPRPPRAAARERSVGARRRVPGDRAEQRPGQRVGRDDPAEPHGDRDEQDGRPARAERGEHERQRAEHPGEQRAAAHHRERHQGLDAPRPVEHLERGAGEVEQRVGLPPVEHRGGRGDPRAHDRHQARGAEHDQRPGAQ